MSTAIVDDQHRAQLLRAARGDRSPRAERVPMGIRYTSGPGVPAARPAAGVTPLAEPAGPAPGGAAELLARAEASNDQRTQQLAARARVLLAELTRRLDAEAEITRLDAQLRDVQDRLAAARQQLRGGPGRAHPTAGGTGVDQKAVRAWAAANGMECSPFGRVRQEVIDAWRAATGQEVRDG